jgi:hypothetical protein
MPGLGVVGNLVCPCTPLNPVAQENLQKEQSRFSNGVLTVGKNCATSRL